MSEKSHSERFVECSQAARVLGLSESRVRQLETAGALPAFRTSRGTRIFRLRDVEQFARERAKQRAAAAS